MVRLGVLTGYCDAHTSGPHLPMADSALPTFWSRLWNKTKKDPLIPLGCAATVGCLTAGLYAFKTGKTGLSQKMMRARVAAQGATIAALLIGSMMGMKGGGASQLERE